MADPLFLTELSRLVQLMRDTFAFMVDLRARDRLAEHIQNPKIPPFLSESIALHLIRQGRILQGMANVRFGSRRESDIVAMDGNGQVFSVEVKGTGSGAWIYLSDKDYSADYLLWVFFDDFFSNATRDSIEVYIVSPQEIPERRQRITLNTLKSIAGGQFEIIPD